MKYVGRDPTGSIVPTELAYVSELDPNSYCIGTGQPKYDITGSPKHYMDAVIADRQGRWLLSQWTSEWVVIEGVAPDVLMRQHRNGSATQSNRKIGINFARIGLPKMAFGALFNTLSANYPAIMTQVTETRGYYWMNASWGVSSFSATFSFIDEDGKVQSTNALPDVMRMLNGKSSLCLGTVAISVTCTAKMVDGKPVADKSSYGLSVKMHNAFSVNVVDYHGPPQQGATGMTIPARIAQKAQAMGRRGAAVTGGTMGSIFSTQSSGVFSGTSSTVPTTKTTESKQYM